MPEIARFYGIIIRMYFNDHNPPHFHAIYNEQEALINIRTLSAFSGQLSPRALGLVIEWATQHQQELLADWERAQSRQPLAPIKPLS